MNNNEDGISSLGEMLKEYIKRYPHNNQFQDYQIRPAREQIVISRTSKKELEKMSEQYICTTSGYSPALNNSVNPLIKLADKEFAKECEDYGLLPDDIQEELEHQASLERKAAAKEAALVILDMTKRKNARIERNVLRIRALRNEIEALKADCKVMDTAFKYGNSTRNYLPLAYALGDHIPSSVDKELLKIKLVEVEVETEVEVEEAANEAA